MSLYLGKNKVAVTTNHGVGTPEWGDITGTLSDQTDLNTALNSKQDTLISGTNIKTINSTSILGNGNIEIDSLPNQAGNNGKYLKTDGSNASWGSISWTYDSTTETLTIS